MYGDYDDDNGECKWRRRRDLVDITARFVIVSYQMKSFQAEDIQVIFVRIARSYQLKKEMKEETSTEYMGYIDTHTFQKLTG